MFSSNLRVAAVETGWLRAFDGASVTFGFGSSFPARVRNGIELLDGEYIVLPEDKSAEDYWITGDVTERSVCPM
jgi:hypothetical protein